jgi:hypothetical protein
MIMNSGANALTAYRDVGGSTDARPRRSSNVAVDLWSNIAERDE